MEGRFMFEHEGKKKFFDYSILSSYFIENFNYFGQNNICAEETFRHLMIKDTFILQNVSR